MKHDPIDDVNSNLQYLSEQLEWIIDGKFEPPRGKEDRREPVATPDDIYNALSGITSHLERQNALLWSLGQLINELGDGAEGYWETVVRRNTHY